MLSELQCMTFSYVQTFFFSSLFKFYNPTSLLMERAVVDICWLFTGFVAVKQNFSSRLLSCKTERAVFLRKSVKVQIVLNHTVHEDLHNISL